MGIEIVIGDADAPDLVTKTESARFSYIWQKVTAALWELYGEELSVDGLNRIRLKAVLPKNQVMNQGDRNVFIQFKILIFGKDGCQVWEVPVGFMDCALVQFKELIQKCLRQFLQAQLDQRRARLLECQEVMACFFPEEENR